MKRARSVWMMVLVTSLSLGSEAAAGEPDALPEPQRTLERVHAAVIAPLKEREAKMSRFSRGARPRERRAIENTTPQTDGSGQTFIAFVIEVRHVRTWSEDMTGCVYADGAVYIKRKGEQRYMASSQLLGKKQSRNVPAQVCQPTNVVAATLENQ